MLTHLKLENFKIWRTTTPIKLAPLTLLLGTNSSGKSSLIQSLLLIRQTVNSDDANVDLNFGSPERNDSVTLGQYKDVLCRQGQTTSTTPAHMFSIEFSWAPNFEATPTIFSARYRKGFAGSAELDYLRLGKDGQGFAVIRRKKSVYRLQLADSIKSLGQSQDFRPERSFAFSASTINRLGKNGEAIKEVGPELLDELGKIIYLGPLRRLAQRDYLWSGRVPSTIGDDGAKAIDALIASGVAKKEASRRNRSIPIEAELFIQTAYWLRQMNLADDLAVVNIGSSGRYALHIINNNEASNLKDVGVGVSQVLPVIVAALFAKTGHIVIIEEPESHLHPLAQSQLAELFSKVSQERQVQFIVETHSEHLFRRMQTIIARDGAKPSDTAMYFVERENQVAKLRSLKIDDLGRVTNWPEGFFGNALGETREQAALAIQRAKELRARDGNVSR